MSNDTLADLMADCDPNEPLHALSASTLQGRARHPVSTSIPPQALIRPADTPFGVNRT